MNSDERQTTLEDCVGGKGSHAGEFRSPEPEFPPVPWESGTGREFESADDADDAGMPANATITETWT